MPLVLLPLSRNPKDVIKSYDLTCRWNMCLSNRWIFSYRAWGYRPRSRNASHGSKVFIVQRTWDVDAFRCEAEQKVDEIVRTIYLKSKPKKVNIEDISSPRCFEIERKLKEICDIPIFHNDHMESMRFLLTHKCIKDSGKRPEYYNSNMRCRSAGIAIFGFF